MNLDRMRLDGKVTPVTGGSLRPDLGMAATLTQAGSDLDTASQVTCSEGIDLR